MSKSICSLLGHMGKVKRLQGRDKTSYKCYKCPEGRNHCYDVEMFDEDLTEDKKGHCPWCHKKMPYQKTWSRYIDCKACNERIHL